jgi:hypothetical protein
MSDVRYNLVFCIMKNLYSFFVIGFIVVFGFLNLYSNHAVAQTDQTDVNNIDFVEISDPALKLNLYAKEQVYPSKAIIMVLEIDSEIDSGRVGVEWTYPSNLLLIQGKTTDIVTVLKGKQTKVEKTFIPVASAVRTDNDQLFRETKFGTRVNAFVPERNYLSSKSIDINFNNLMEKIPFDESYINAKERNKIVRTSAIVGGTAFVLVIILTGIKLFRDYLNSDDQVIY